MYANHSLHILFYQSHAEVCYVNHELERLKRQQITIAFNLQTA